MKPPTADSAASYFAFRDADRAVEILRPDTPQPWINYLSNSSLHAFVSQAGGGFAWWKSPIVYRLTRYRQYNLPVDSPGFYVYLREKDGTVWSPTWRPCPAKPDHWKAVHQPGRTRFTAARGGLGATLTFFVCPDADVLVWDLALTATDGRDHALDVFAYCEFSQMIWQDETTYGYYTKLQLKTFYDARSGSVNHLFHVCNYPKGYEPPLVYLAGTGKVVSFSGSRLGFNGDYGDERDPRSLHAPRLPGDTLACGEPAAALHNRVAVRASGRAARLAFFLGVAPGVISDKAAAERRRNADLARLRRPGAVDRQAAKAARWWEDHFAVLQSGLPDPAAARQINTWSVVNAVVTGRYSRSVNTEAPGVRGVGFRDTCQDMIAIAYRKPAWAADTLRYLLSQQYADGHTAHLSYREEWYPPVGGKPKSDNHLWPALVAYAVAAETGDLGFLETPAPFLRDDGTPGAAAPLWRHLMAAVDFAAAHRGAHGLLLTLGGDWNDIIGRFSERGRGETVFASQQYVYTLRLLIELADAAGKRDDAARMRVCLAQQEAALLACAWDGGWWRRGFDDDGVPVGSSRARFGRIFLNPQSWAVISGVGDRGRLVRAMDAAHAHLQTPVGLKLMAPGFAGWNLEPGKTPVGYGAGCGENGAIFCHANPWAVMAEALLGRGDRAWQVFTQLIPANVIRTVGPRVYRAEPYAWVSNIVGPENPAFGWGNVTQITGTAPWMDVAATQYLLGVRPVLAGLRLAPCVPAAWEGFTVTRRFSGCQVAITVAKDHSGDCRVRACLAGGKPLEPQADGSVLLPRAALAGRKRLAVRLTLGTA